MQKFINGTMGFLLLGFTSASYALDIHVSRFSDRANGVCGSDCSLREAVSLANANPGLDRILLNAGTYSLTIPAGRDSEDEDAIIDDDSNTDGDLDITGDVVIQGAKEGTTIIDGTKNHRLIETLSGKSQLIRLTLMNGITSHYGGAIENHAELILRHCTLTKNEASGWDSPATGGAISNPGTLSIYYSLITHNRATGGDGSLGPGGGIYNTGTLTVRDSTISHNAVSGYDGGGVGGGLFNAGNADIRRSLFFKNKTSYYGSGSAAITINGGVLKMVNTTISDNEDGEDGRGGAVANGAGGGSFKKPGKLYLTNVTITDSSYYGLLSQGETYVKNSIIAGNANQWTGTAQNCKQYGGTLEFENVIMGYEHNDITCYSTSVGIPNNKTFITLLEPLADNGGPTLTHALRKESPAIDAGAAPCAAYDQRSSTAPIDGDNNGMANCDVGAYEFQPSTPVSTH